MPLSPDANANPTLTADALARPAAAPRPVAQLVVLLQADAPGQASSRHLLAHIDRVRIGRGPRFAAHRTREDGRAVLVLELPDALVSTRHLVLERRGETFSLEDVGSKNGTALNAAPVVRETLCDGDLIEVGQTFILFRDAVALDLRTPADTLDAVALAPAPAWATFHDPMAERFRQLARAAGTAMPVLILGETGTGKEVVARTLHGLSGRPGELVSVNCGAIPTGLVEAELFGHRKGAFTGSGGERVGWIRSAERGTLFLDEIGELPAAVQATFLRALESGEVTPLGADRPLKVDFRLVSATNRDLDAQVERGTFRADLRARLGSMAVTLPPLRARPEDLGLLMGATFRRLLRPGAAPPRLSREAARRLLGHTWPGNVRELVQVLSQLLALVAPDESVTEALLPDSVRAAPRGRGGARSAESGPLLGASGAATPAASDEALSEAEERARLSALLSAALGNVAEVARRQGRHRELVYRDLRRLGLEPADFRR